MSFIKEGNMLMKIIALACVLIIGTSTKAAVTSIDGMYVNTSEENARKEVSFVILWWPLNLVRRLINFSSTCDFR